MPSHIKSSSKTKIGEWMTRLGHLRVRNLAEHVGQELFYPTTTVSSFGEMRQMRQYKKRRLCSPLTVLRTYSYHDTIGV